VLVHFDFKEQKSMPFPDHIRHQLAEHLSET
jgi:acyl-CoA thioesterase FadM